MMSTKDSKKRPRSDSDEDLSPAKRIKREKNRISAARSREKKSRMFQQMQEEIQILTAKNGQLTRTLALLTSQCQNTQSIQQENYALHEKIRALEIHNARVSAENAALHGVISAKNHGCNHHQQSHWGCCPQNVAQSIQPSSIPLTAPPPPPELLLQSCDQQQYRSGDRYGSCADAYLPQQSSSFDGISSSMMVGPSMNFLKPDMYPPSTTGTPGATSQYNPPIYGDAMDPNGLGGSCFDLPPESSFQQSAMVSPAFSSGSEQSGPCTGEEYLVAANV